MSDGVLEEVIIAEGHEHVSATHESTFEITSDDFLTPAGDCILAIEADQTPSTFDENFVTACQDTAATIAVTLEAGGYMDQVRGHGHPDLTFASDRSMVWRTSEYVDDRTVGIGMDGAAADLDRDLVAALADGAALTATISVDREGV